MKSALPGQWYVITKEAEFQDLREDWERLFAANPKHCPFQSWSWTSAWLKHLAGPHELHVICFRDEGQELQFVLPLVRSSGNKGGKPARLYNVCGYGRECSDHVSALRLPGLDARLADVAATGIAEACNSTDRVELGNLDDGEEFASILAGEIRHRHRIVRHEQFTTCPAVELPDTWEAFLQKLSSNFRSQVRRFRKRVENSENAGFRSLDASEAESFAHELIRLNRSRIGQKGQVSSLEDPAFRDFLVEVIPAMAISGLATMDVVEMDGQIVGAALNLMHGQSIYYYMGGFDDAAKNLRPGTALFARAIERGIAEGYLRYDFLRGAEPYKYRWGATDVDTHHITVYPQGIVRGRLACSVESVRDKAKTLVRRLRD